MERTLDPVYLAVREELEPALERLGYRLDEESHQFGAFGSAQAEYDRRGSRLRLHWDGKDRWAWVTVAPQPANAFPEPDTYRDIDQPFADSESPSPHLNTVEQGRDRAAELIARLSTTLNSLYARAV